LDAEEKDLVLEEALDLDKEKVLDMAEDLVLEGDGKINPSF